MVSKFCIKLADTQLSSQNRHTSGKNAEFCLKQTKDFVEKLKETTSFCQLEFILMEYIPPLASYFLFTEMRVRVGIL